MAVPVLLALLLFGVLLPRQLRARHTELTQPAHLRRTFELLYARELLGDSTDVYERAYAVVGSGVHNVVTKFGLLSFPSLTRAHVAGLELTRDKHCQEMLELIHRTVTKI